MYSKNYTYDDLKKEIIKYAKDCSNGIDVKNDEDWQEGIAHKHYEYIKKKMHLFEEEIRPLNVKEWHDIINEISEILWI